MSEVRNTNELSDLLKSGEERAFFPAETNLLLDDGLLTLAQICELERAAEACGRSLHCH